MKRFFIVYCLLVSVNCFAQSSYADSIQKHIDNYVKEHGVVKGDDKKHLHFYAVNTSYKVKAVMELQPNSQWFKMDASGPIKQLYRVYGIARFIVNGKEVQLNIYQNQSLMQTEKYADHLFIPFIDATSGKETYEGGRYIDISISDIKNGVLELDFNKAYNPYCAYVSGIYSCPIPPKENRLAVAIEAGEKKFGKEH
jgi:uncharacterized protein